MTDDLFPGNWELDPTQCTYEFGEPPESAMYFIRATEKGYFITMQWVTSAGEPKKTGYEGIPDGKARPFKNSTVVTFTMTRMDVYTLDTETRQKGESVNHARRVISEDGQTMTITQTGQTPEGETYTNCSVYIRKD